MGKLCTKEAQSVEKAPLLPQETEITVPTYKNESDKLYEPIEKKFNYLRKIPFQDYLHSLVNFSTENATLDEDYSKASIEISSNDQFYGVKISSDEFQSFIDNKLFKHKIIYEELVNNENAASLFEKILIEIQNSLVKKINEKNGEKSDDSYIIMKGLLIPLGILYCSGPNYIKIKTLFNLFQEGGNIKSSEKLNLFLLAHFLTGAYCVTSARNRLKKYDLIGDIEKSVVIKLHDTCEFKDSVHLVEVVNKLIFGEDLSKNLSYEDFKAKFADENKDTSLGFMLSGPGIRFMQTKHNV